MAVRRSFLSPFSIKYNTGILLFNSALSLSGSSDDTDDSASFLSALFLLNESNFFLVFVFA